MVPPRGEIALIGDHVVNRKKQSLPIADLDGQSDYRPRGAYLLNRIGDFGRLRQEMATYSPSQQRALDIASGEAMDRAAQNKMPGTAGLTRNQAAAPRDLMRRQQHPDPTPEPTASPSPDSGT